MWKFLVSLLSKFRLCPTYSSVLILSYPADEVEHLLRLATTKFYPISQRLEKEREEQIAKFYGSIEENQFTIFKRIRQPHNFLPLIKGRIEAAKSGTIVLLEYNMFFGAKTMLRLWSAITLFLAFIFCLFVSKPALGLMFLGLFVLNYIVCVYNFHNQVKDSEKTLREVLEYE